MAPSHYLGPLRMSRQLVQRQSVRAFSLSTSRSIKEDADRSAADIERAKQDQLKEQEQGKGRWKEELASAGESSIAADKENVGDHKQHMKKLQEETKQKGEKGDL